MLDINDLGSNSPELENHLLERFGDKFLEDAVRIVKTKMFSPTDGPIIHEAMCIVIAMYVRKIKNGEINQSKVLH